MDKPEDRSVLSDWEKFKLAQSCDGARIMWMDCLSCGLQFRVLARYDFSVSYVCPVCRDGCVRTHVLKR